MTGSTRAEEGGTTPRAQVLIVDDEPEHADVMADHHRVTQLWDQRRARKVPKYERAEQRSAEPARSAVGHKEALSRSCAGRQG